ncbi:Xanthine permease [Clostridiaceae bacterium JG1575]|nr:Xanthine permease [Clostridiaceae bacterium JG1575]
MEKKNQSNGTANQHSKSLFRFDGKPDLSAAMPLGIQHVLAMIIGNVTPAIIVANTLKLSPKDATLLIQYGLLVSAIATLLQIYGVWKLGSRLPVMMGVSFSYVPVLVSIATSYGNVGAILGAQLVGSVAAFLVGLFIKPMRKLFPPIVAGTVVLTIGLSLYGIGINYIAGGTPGLPGYGSAQNWFLGILTLLVVLACSSFGKGIVKLGAILIGILVGYVVALFMNAVNFAPLMSAEWVLIPRPLYFGMEFHGTAIFSMVLMYIVNSIQAVGDLSSTTIGGMDREVTDDELFGGITGYGVTAAIGSLLGGLPVATYSQNVGIVGQTKVVARKVFAIAAFFVLAASLVPKFGALMTTIPRPVIGGATVGVFGMITMSGIKLITQQPLTARNMSIVGMAVALGMGISTSPAALAQAPQWFMLVFGKSPVVIATLAALVLNLIIPDKTLEQEQKEREEMDHSSQTA